MTPTNPEPLLVRACIPHYYRGEGDKNGYGSNRPGAKLARSLALSHCLSSLIRLQRGSHDAVLHIADRTIDHIPQPENSPESRPLRFEIFVYTDGEHELGEILDFYNEHICRKPLKVADPKLLALRARDALINSIEDQPADLLLYLEDDLIIRDRHYLDKQLWFLERTDHRFSLMPHRYEHVSKGDIDRLLIDGPLAKTYLSNFTSPQKNIASGLYRGQQPVSFDIASNPHSGTFTLSRNQAKHLLKKQLPTSGFVGPLETAATLTVLKFFPVLKPSTESRDFLTIEHGHPSFRHYTKTLPHRTQKPDKA